MSSEMYNMTLSKRPSVVAGDGRSENSGKNKGALKVD
jgi:hypothetical protein